MPEVSSLWSSFCLNKYGISHCRGTQLNNEPHPLAIKDVRNTRKKKKEKEDATPYSACIFYRKLTITKISTPPFSLREIIITQIIQYFWKLITYKFIIIAFWVLKVKLKITFGRFEVLQAKPRACGSNIPFCKVYYLLLFSSDKHSSKIKLHIVPL